MTADRESLCSSPGCVSLRRELTSIFGVPVVRDCDWNEAMLRLIAEAEAEVARLLHENAALEIRVARLADMLVGDAA